jgi:hypothetical protein
LSCAYYCLVGYAGKTPEVQQQFAPVKSVVHGLFDIRLALLRASRQSLLVAERFLNSQTGQPDVGIWVDIVSASTGTPQSGPLCAPALRQRERVEVSRAPLPRHS